MARVSQLLGLLRLASGIQDDTFKGKARPLPRARKRRAGSKFSIEERLKAWGAFHSPPRRP